LGAAEQCEAVLGAAAAWLQEEHGRSLHEAAFAEVQVRDLGCFEAVNAVYARSFGADPPPRVCIQTPLPEALHLRVRLLLRPKQGEALEGNTDAAVESGSLRVQSISTWAMACIGPYSQALWVGPLLLSAGVLGLVPHSMTLPTASEAAAAASASGGAAAPRRQWEAELWLLMRSLQNVLEVMGSSFGEARLAHVYVAGDECELQEASEQVLGYMRRDAPSATPILAGARVPRLPKDGSVEVNVVCWSQDSSSASAPVVTSTLHKEGEALLPGAITLTSWQVSGTRVSMAEFAVADAFEAEAMEVEAVAFAAEQCAAAALSAAEAGAGGLSLQVQCALPDAGPIAMEAAEAAADKLGLSEQCAVACMPVMSLGPRVLVRSILFVA